MKKFTALLMIILSSSFLFGLNIQQTVPKLIETESKAKFIIDITEFSEISSIDMFYKFSQDNIFKKETVDINGNTGRYGIELTIPKAVTEIEYYYKIYIQGGTIYSYPEFNPEMQPFRLQILPNHTNFQNIFTLLNPSSFKFNSKDEIMFAISYFPVSDRVNVNKSYIMLDGKKIKDAKVTKNVAVKNFRQLPNGNHTIEMVIKLNNNKTIISPKWNVNVGKNIHRAIKYNGNISYFSYYNKKNYDHNEDSKNTQNDLTLNFNSTYLKNRLNGKIYVSSLESEQKQAINRFSLLYDSPVLEIDLGDNTPHFSQLGITNNVRGITSNLHFHYFRLLSTYGYLKRNIACKQIGDKSYSPGSFDRKIIAGRIEIGAKNGFELGLSVTKNKDIISSLDENQFTTNDSLKSLIITPKDNILIGSDFNYSLLENRLHFYGEISVSMYNNNIYEGAISKDDLEDYGIDLPFDPQDYEQLFVINKNVAPYKLGLSMAAITSGIRYYDRINNFNFTFGQYGSAYNSLSSNLPQDKRILSFSDQLNLQNKFFLLLGGSFSQNNLSDNKVTTNKGKNIYSNILIKTGNAQTLHFRGQYSLNENDDKSMKSSYNLIESGYDFSILNQSNYPTNMSVSISRAYNNNETLDNSENTKTNINVFSISKLTYFPVDIKLGFTLNNVKDVTDFAETTLDDINNKYWNNNYLLGAKFHFLRDKVVPYINYQYTNVSEKDSQNKHNISIGTSYLPFEKTSISTKYSFYSYNTDTGKNDYKNNVFSLNITQRF